MCGTLAATLLVAAKPQYACGGEEMLRLPLQAARCGTGGENKATTFRLDEKRVLKALPKRSAEELERWWTGPRCCSWRKRKQPWARAGAAKAPQQTNGLTMTETARLILESYDRPRGP